MSKPVSGSRLRTGVAAAALVVVAGGAGVGTPARASIAPFGAVDAVAVSPATGRVLVGIDDRKAGRCLWWSDDQGAHWQVVRGLGKASGVTALAFSQSQPNIVYAAVIWELPSRQSFGSGFLVSSDGGARWHPGSWKQRVTVFGSTEWAAINELTVDPSRPDTVYADTRVCFAERSTGARAGRPHAPACLPPSTASR
jgi:hypothetical protein